MKSTIPTIPHDIFFHPAAALPRTHRNAHRVGPVLLEPDERKQEVVCSVILTLCLLFSLAVCVAQFAIS